MPISIDRRRLLLTAAAALSLAPLPGAAMTQDQARALVNRVMTDLSALLASGRSEAQMMPDFEAFFARYGDLPAISRSVLGPPARNASAAQLSAFTAAFQTYMARKYGRQFRRFIGAQADVSGAREISGYWEVVSTMSLRGEPPFEVRWHVSDRSGQQKFFNLIINGVNLLAAERQEVASMLERRGGNLDRMIADLRAM